MIFSDSGIQSLACRFVKRVIETPYFDSEDLSDLSPTTIASLTGKPARFNRNNQETHLSDFRKLLCLPHHDQRLENRINNNCRLIANALCLDHNCQTLIRFALLCSANLGLDGFIKEHVHYNCSNTNILIAEALGMTSFELQDATLNLSQSCLFSEISYDIMNVLHLPKLLTKNALTVDAKYFMELMCGLFEVLPKSHLTLKSFHYLHLEYLPVFLQKAIKQRCTGINILLHGDSGVGKTELAKLLSSQSHCQLISVKAYGDGLDEQTDELTAKHNQATLRLQHHGLLQLMPNTHTQQMLIIDECEDVFSHFENGKHVSKDRLHAALSDNPIPTLWVTNHIDFIPASCIRRFSFVLEVTTPPRKIKEEILDQALKGLKVSNKFKQALSTMDDLTFGHVDKAAKMAKLIGLKGNAAETCIDEHIDQTLSASGLETSKQTYQSEIPFNSDFLNLKNHGGTTNNTINALIKSAKSFDGLRSLLFGPPGVGKTAFVNHIAAELDKPLITVKCSDVLDKYVGGSEKNIARLFKASHEQEAILFIDEIDSLLTSRSQLSNQHERQLVNEILTQIDQSESMIFAATNYAHNLDEALLRRFDFKLTLTYLTSAQVLKIYADNFGKPSKEIQTKLSKLNQLTPGDFAIVVRRNRFSAKPLSDTKNLNLLTAENNRKTSNKTIGFVRS